MGVKAKEELRASSVQLYMFKDIELHEICLESKAKASCTADFHLEQENRKGFVQELLK